MKCFTVGAMVLSLCMWASVGDVAAQTPQPVPANQPLTGVFTASPDVVTGYRCWVDNVQVEQTSELRCRIPPQAPGNHLWEVSAFNGFGESLRVGLAFVAGTAPRPPSDLQLSLQATVRIHNEDPPRAEVLALKVAVDPAP